MNAKWKYLLTGTIISWCLGFLGADRFYRGQILLGVIKLITFGGIFIWYIVDALIWTVELGKFDEEQCKASGKTCC